MMNVFETSNLGKGRAHRPVLWVCLHFMAGIVMEHYLRLPLMYLFSAVAGLFILSWFRRSVSVLLLSFIFLGSIYLRSYETCSIDHVSRITYGYHKEPVLVEGVVVSDVELRPFFKGRKTVFTMNVRRIKTPWGWKEKTGPVLVHLFRAEDVRYGDELVIEGKLHRPFNFAQDSQFSYRDYLYRRGITYILSVKKEGKTEILRRKQGNGFVGLSFRFKHRLVHILRAYLPQHEAGIMQAFLLGDRYDIPKNFYDLCKLSGVAHIIAISGFNVGIVAYMIFLLLNMFPIPRRGQYALTIILLLFYAFLTGSQPPVVRAAIMAVVFLAGFILEREQESVNTLSLAALILLLMNPLNLFDVGFQLSFVSVLAIILLYPFLMNKIGQRWPFLRNGSETNGIVQRAVRYLCQSAVFSLVAYLGVMPLVLYYFHLVTPVVMIANLVVVPISSFIIFLGMGLLLTGTLTSFVATAFAHCIVVLLNLMVLAVAFFAGMPGAYFEISRFPLWAVFLYYGMIVLVWGGYVRRKKFP